VLAAVIEGTTLVSRPPVSALERLSPGCFFSLAYASGACVQLLPDPSTYLIVEVPKVSAPRCVISGPRLKSVRSVPVEDMQVIGIRLRPGVAFLLTGVCTERWVGRRESLEDVLGPCVSELAVQISESPCTDAQFDLLESFLVCAACGQRSGPARMHRLTSDSRIERRDARARHCGSMRPKLPTTGAAAAGLGRNLTETLVQDRSFPGSVGMRRETTSQRLDLCGCGTELCRSGPPDS
jgi:hypothetical protein